MPLAPNPLTVTQSARTSSAINRVAALTFVTSEGFACISENFKLLINIFQEN
jgi:hypothetical protein